MFSIKKILLKLYRWVLPSHYNDHVLIAQRKIHNGFQTAQRKVGIYLIFPKGGVIGTHLLALQALIDNGYAPLVVSNLPLDTAELALLQPLVWRIIERQNFGYDFGGYREAVMWLAPQINELDRLVLLNDSTWFPLPSAMNWLEEAEALQVDLVGALAVGHSGRHRAHLFLQTPWKSSTAHRNFHYGSYALSIGAAMLRCDGFLQFWKQLRLTQGKNRTIKRGEIGFTQWACATGFSHAATTNLMNLDHLLANMEEARLRQVFAKMMIVQDNKAQAVLDKLKQEADIRYIGRSEMEAFIRMAVARRGAGLVLPSLLIEDFRFAFLKRFAASPRHQYAASMAFLINSLDEPMRSLALKESGLQPPQIP